MSFSPPLSFLVLWSFVACDPRPGRKGERGAGNIDLGEREIIRGLRRQCAFFANLEDGGGVVLDQSG